MTDCSFNMKLNFNGGWMSPTIVVSKRTMGYDTFSVDTEANKYAASTTSSMDWKVSTQMSSNVPFRTVADSSFVQSQKFSTKDQGA